MLQKGFVHVSFILPRIYISKRRDNWTLNVQKGGRACVLSFVAKKQHTSSPYLVLLPTGTAPSGLPPSSCPGSTLSHQWQPPVPCLREEVQLPFPPCTAHEDSHWRKALPMPLLQPPCQPKVQPSDAHQDKPWLCGQPRTPTSMKTASPPLV